MDAGLTVALAIVALVAVEAVCIAARRSLRREAERLGLVPPKENPPSEKP